MKENLAGPGGGPSMEPTNLPALFKNIAKHGSGAFPTGGDEPPKPRKTPTAGYDGRRKMRKK